jgi:thiosulfate/3-mercaptopyruvate sulfurtransferase
MTRSMNLEPISRRTLFAAIAGTTLLASGSRNAVAQSGTVPLVVDLDWLRDRATRPDLRVIDVSPLHVYRDRHIDSAAHAWWRDTVDPNYPVFGAVLTQGDEEAHRQRVLDSLELVTGDDVVVYDNERGFRAARLVWFLRFLGIERVALLDASYDEWKRAEFPIDSASTTSTSPIVDPQAGYYLVTEQLRIRLQNPGVQVIDIRTDAERADDLGGQMPLGQIPGSIRLPWTDLLDAAGRLIPPDASIELTTDLHLDPSLETVLYGSFGVDTALSWLALRNAGFDNLLTYDRGWVEWSILPGLPQEPLS